MPKIKSTICTKFLLLKSFFDKLFFINRKFFRSSRKKKQIMWPNGDITSSTLTRCLIVLSNDGGIYFGQPFCDYPQDYCMLTTEQTCIFQCFCLLMLLRRMLLFCSQEIESCLRNIYLEGFTVLRIKSTLFGRTFFD